MLIKKVVSSSYNTAKIHIIYIIYYFFLKKSFLFARNDAKCA